MIMTKLGQRRKGFTLVELAIVLAVAAVLFTGLWRLLSGGNQQLKDSASASQQAQLISSVKSFLASPDGQNWLASQCGAGNTTGCTLPQTMTLGLPPAASAAGSVGCPTSTVKTVSTPNLLPSQASAWCSALPSGTSASTTNSYGQTYSIQIAWNSPTSSPQVAPTTYSAMIVTQTGTPIPDTSGGRISAQIGGDGGFVYTASSCGQTVCGAFGAWGVDPATYGYPTAGGATVAVGHIASRTYITPEQSSNLPWLARLHIPSDLTQPYPYNTFSSGTNVWLNTTGTFGDPTAPGTAQNTLFGTFSATPGSIYGGSIQALNNLVTGMNNGEKNPSITVNDNNNCKAQSLDGSNNMVDGPSGTGTTCYATLQVNGNQITTGMVQASTLWASEFLYGATTSDIRMKKNIQPLDNALDRVMKLEPVTFRYKRDNRADIGFIAQDIQKVFPELVQGKPGGVLGVNYMGFVAPLVSSIQELKKQNDELREQLKQQQQQIDALKQRSE